MRITPGIKGIRKFQADNKAGWTETMNVIIWDKYRIAAARQAALMEDNYRYGRVYGMGRR